MTSADESKKTRAAGFDDPTSAVGVAGAVLQDHLADGRTRHLQRARRPLFPGYLFVQIDPERQEWRRINSTYGVSRLVALERGCPTRVPPQVMAGIFGHCDGDTWRVQADGLEPGTEARLVQGPFARMIATVEALPEADRVLVLLELMGRATSVGVSLDDLEIL